jgi:hypothetical protein
MDQCEALFADAHCSLDLETGPLLRALLVDGPEGQQRLFIAIHHLVVDGVSWRVLLDELQTVYRLFEAGDAVNLPAKTSAFKDWAARLQAYAGSESLREELSWWVSQLAGPIAELPCERPQGGRQNRHAQTVRVRLERAYPPIAATGAAPTAPGQRLLLTGGPRVVPLGRHESADSTRRPGRQAPFDEIDLTRTVGWFTSAYPLRLMPCKAGPRQRRSRNNCVRCHTKVWEVACCAAWPMTVPPVMAAPGSAITFNYLGQFDQSFGAGALFRLSMKRSAAHDPLRPLPKQLSVDSQVRRTGTALDLSVEHHLIRHHADLADAYAARPDRALPQDGRG